MSLHRDKSTTTSQALEHLAQHKPETLRGILAKGNYSDKAGEGRAGREGPAGGAADEAGTIV